LKIGSREASPPSEIPCVVLPWLTVEADRLVEMVQKEQKKYNNKSIQCLIVFLSAVSVSLLVFQNLSQSISIPWGEAETKTLWERKGYHKDDWIFLNALEKEKAREFCRHDYESNKRPLSLIDIVPNPPKTQKILCYVHTISTHKEKSQAIRETWGPRCDKLLFISNETLPDTVDVPLVAYDHVHLWDKSRKSFEYILKHYPDFDWYFKADDDTYVIMDNLRAFLVQQSLSSPLLLGHRFILPVDSKANYEYVFSDFLQKHGSWMFPSGGSGYALNNVLLRNIVQHLSHDFCFPDRLNVGEDVAAGLCARDVGGSIPDTRDWMQRQRFHPFNPVFTYVYEGYWAPDSWWVKYHAETGGIQFDNMTISNESVAFHYNDPELMHYIDMQLYACRRYQEKTVPRRFRDALRNKK